MTRAMMIAAAALLVAVPVVAVTSGALDRLSSDSASAALFAEDVRLAPPLGNADATEDGAADLGVAGRAARLPTCQCRAGGLGASFPATGFALPYTNVHRKDSTPLRPDDWS